jgi:hypothetical protein
MNRNLLRGLLDSTSAIALDMCGTFMFGHDRFGPDEQYGRTYRSLGGTTLSDDRVRAAIIACFRTMNTIYEDIARHDSFPSVSLTLGSLAETREQSQSEL